MNKSELIKAVAETSGIELKQADILVNTFFDSMKEKLLEGGRVEIRGFGSFKTKSYPGYTGRNPRTGEQVQVAPKKLPVFKVGRELYSMLNKQ